MFKLSYLSRKRAPTLFPHINILSIWIFANILPKKIDIFLLTCFALQLAIFDAKAVQALRPNPHITRCLKKVFLNLFLGQLFVGVPLVSRHFLCSQSIIFHAIVPAAPPAPRILGPAFFIFNEVLHSIARDNCTLECIFCTHLNAIGALPKHCG